MCRKRKASSEMPNVKILIWRNKEGTGEPEVEVKVPLSMAKWVPRLMRFVPKRTKEETWGDEIDFDQMFAGIEKMVNEASVSGHSELMEVKTKDSYVKISVDG
jgi:hypothetical protein